jgi:hypothetical protein
MALVKVKPTSPGRRGVVKVKTQVVIITVVLQYVTKVAVINSTIV